ncbi:MAG: hypothetical protein IE917_02050 [Betaproteobacteria bacterium]|nr:hypothetical protein [Betaproteobacteria bacterium]
MEITWPHGIPCGSLGHDVAQKSQSGANRLTGAKTYSALISSHIDRPNEPPILEGEWNSSMIHHNKELASPAFQF